MPSWRKSFRSKVIVLTLIVVIGSQIANMAAVLFTMNGDVTKRAESQLDSGSKIFQAIMATRGNLLEQIVNPLSQSPAFKAAVATGNMASISEALTDSARRAGADIALLLNLDGSVVAATGDIIPTDRPFTKLARNTRAALLVDNLGFEMVSVPVKAPNVIGYISMGYAVSDPLAQQIAGLTGLEVSFLSGYADGRQNLLGSTLARERRALLINTAIKISNGADPIQASEEMKKEFMSRRRIFLPSDSSIFVILQKPLVEAMAPYNALRTTMLHALATTALCALIMAFFLSRTITRPIRALLLAARRMRVGNYKKKLEINTDDEFNELAKAFDSMREGIAEREQRIVYQAEYDALTGLPNRVKAIDLLRSALRQGTKDGTPLVVMIMHLQRFREIQSSLGHEIGDEVLRATAERLDDNLDDGFVLARLEGDQFLIIAPNTDRDEGQRLAKALAKVLDSSLTVQSINVTLDACIGLCVCPEHGRQPDELLRRAAVAKNDAQHSQDRVRVYQNGREARHVRQLAILGDLRRATAEDELKLYLQPKVTLKDTQVCGAEALLRWDHPELGQINPNEFIPLAESAGSISMITEWVLRRTIQQARLWKDQNIHLPIAVNLSGRDLQNDRLPMMIKTELDTHGMESSCLILEITEEAVVHNLDHAVKILNELRQMGLRTSMDDFGTGYSSLSHLQKLPVDELKIDRTFVTYLPEHKQNAAIVRSVIDLAHNLGLEVVAEGVETTAALRWLREEGCERAQGYYLSKPMPAELFVNWLRSWERLAGEDDEKGNTADSLILRPRLIVD